MINTAFLNSSNYGWSQSKLQNIEYSFLSELPQYFTSNYLLLGSHQAETVIAGITVYTGSFVAGTEFEFVANQKNSVQNFLTSSSYNDQISFNDIISINISENIDGNGDITFLNQNKVTPESGSLTYPVNALNTISGNAADIFIDSTDFHNTDLTLGKYGYWNLIHEMGHAIGGLDDFAGKTEEGTYVDNQKYTMMSYNTYSGYFDSSGNDTATNKVHASGLMLLDIKALRDTYTVRDVRTEDGNVYKLGQGLGYDNDATKGFLYTIVDDNGANDAIDASDFTVSAEIDLREGHYSSIGVNGDGQAWLWDSYAYLSGDDDPDPGNVAIAYGTEIENAIGTDFNDRIIGNALDNTLTGGAGSDVLIGGAGLDTVDYDDDGSTVGTLTISSTLDEKGMEVVDGFAGTDTLHGIETLKTGDHDLTFNVYDASDNLNGRVEANMNGFSFNDSDIFAIDGTGDVTINTGTSTGSHYVTDAVYGHTITTQIANYSAVTSALTVTANGTNVTLTSGGSTTDMVNHNLDALYVGNGHNIINLQSGHEVDSVVTGLGIDEWTSVGHAGYADIDYVYAGGNDTIDYNGGYDSYNITLPYGVNTSDLSFSETNVRNEGYVPL
jgi:hypothetical protein